MPVVTGFDGGTQLGKRYADEELGLEVLCTKAGEGSISVGETILEVKGAASRSRPRTEGVANSGSVVGCEPLPGRLTGHAERPADRAHVAPSSRARDAPPGLGRTAEGYSATTTG